jgi:hypothetical protein
MHQRDIRSKYQHNHLLAIAFVPDRSGEAHSVGRLNIASIFLGKGWFGGDRLSTTGELSALVHPRTPPPRLHELRDALTAESRALASRTSRSRSLRVSSAAR